MPKSQLHQALGAAAGPPGMPGQTRSAIERHRLMSVLALVLAGFGVLGVAAALWHGFAPGSMVAFGGGLVVALALVPIIVRGGKRTDLGGSIVLSAFVLLFLGFAYAVGGLDGPVLVVLPAVPLMATLLLTPRAGILAALIICSCVGWFLGLHLSGHVFPSIALSATGARVLQAVMLLLGTLLVAVTAWAIEQRNRNLQNALEAVAVTDSLTELHNRRSFDSALAQRLKLARKQGLAVTLLLLDVDNLKQYNEAHGHRAGDKCLTLVAHAIRRSIVQQREFAARISGDEFAIVLAGATAAYSRNVAERVRLFIEASGLPGEVAATAPITITIGIGMLGPDERPAEPAEELFDRADKALIRAKNNGRNRLAFSAEAVA